MSDQRTEREITVETWLSLGAGLLSLFTIMAMVCFGDYLEAVVLGTMVGVLFWDFDG